MKRTENCIKKLNRMNKSLRHQEPDRVPVSDFFWGSFVKQWRQEFGLPADMDIYRYYDLDWVVTVPNMDPHIKPFDVLEENDEQIIVRTGYEAVIRKKFADPMPAFVKFDTDTLEKMQAFRFDDPADDRRFFKGGDNQLAGVGDGFTRNLPPWIETVRTLYPNFPVFGSICEVHEQLWRMIGTENVMLWMGLYPDELMRFVERLQEFLIELTKAQIKAADGLLAGMVIFGDVAYTRDMMFSPDCWRRFFKPCVKALVEVCHQANLPVIYHGCGNVSKIFEDFIETGIDAYNPLEAKAGLDVVALRRRYGHRLGFCGNMDVTVWAEADWDTLKQVVLTKLNAAKGGGYIFQSDHSVPGNLPPANYDYVVKLIREFGDYPLKLGQYDLPDVK